MTVDERECNAGIDGGCCACELCDPEWWDRLRVEEASRMTVEECIDATILAASTYYRDPERWMDDAPWLEVYGMQQRYTDTMLERAESHMDNARYWRDVGRPVAMRYHLVQWRICREAIRAIERERSGR